jgi:hypothetical protein
VVRKLGLDASRTAGLQQIEEPRRCLLEGVGWNERNARVAMIVGFVLALILFGLPLGIIGLFIASMLDQLSPEMENTAPTSDGRDASKHRLSYMRAIVGAARYK